MSDAGGIEIDLRDRLRFAADSLAADFENELTADHAEELVFSSAEGLLAAASVTDFVPILAERRARLAVRAGVAPPSPAPPAAPAGPPVPQHGAPSPPPAPGRPDVDPLLALPGEAVTSLRERLERAKTQVAGWQTEISGR